MRSGVFTVGVFGCRCVVGMGRVFDCVLFVDAFVMRMFFVHFDAGRRFRHRSDGCLDDGSNRCFRLRFRCRRFTRYMQMIGFAMRVFVLMLVRMFMAFVVMMIRVRRVMPGVMSV